jgi:hypothetical protein
MTIDKGEAGGESQKDSIRQFYISQPVADSLSERTGSGFGTTGNDGAGSYDSFRARLPAKYQYRARGDGSTHARHYKCQPV